MNAGWKCPNCGKAHSPEVLTCPEREKIEQGARLVYMAGHLTCICDGGCERTGICLAETRAVGTA